MAGLDDLLDANLAFRVLYVTGTYGHRLEIVVPVHPYESSDVWSAT